MKLSDLKTYKIVSSAPTPLPAKTSQPATGDLLDKASGIAGKVTDFLGLHGAVDTIGTNLAGIGIAGKGLATGRIDEANQQITQLGRPTLKQNIGAGLQIGGLTAGLGAAAPATVAGAAGLGATLGAAQTGGKALAENQNLPAVGVEAAKGAAIGGALSGMTALAGKFLERVGDKIQYSIIKPTQADVKDGFNIATIKKHNIGGSLPTVFKQTEGKLDDLTNQLNTKLASSDATISLNDVYKNTLQRMTGGKLSSFGSNTSVGTALKQLQDEISSVGTDLSITEAQVVKRAAGHYGAWQYGMFDPDSTARQQVYNVFYNEMKQAIEKNSPAGVREINKQMSELIPVLNAVIRRIPVAERNNAISLTDVIGLVGSSIDPRALGITLLNALSKSGTVGNVLSRTGAAIPGAAPTIGTLGTAAFTGAASERTTSQIPAGSPLSQSTSQNPTTVSQSPQDPNKPMTLNDDGSITIKGTGGRKDITINPADVGGAGSVAKVGVKAMLKGGYTVADTLKEYLLHELPKAGSLKGTMNTALAKDVDGFIEFLKKVKNPTVAEMHKGLEMLRLQGKNVKPIVDEILKTSEFAQKQLRDAIGRYAK